MRDGNPFDTSLRILALRDHSEGELKRKLTTKGFDVPAVEQCLVRLRELGYLDDARFARTFASSAVRNGRGYGVRLKMELARRGVDGGIIAKVLSEMQDEFSEGDLLAELLQRRFAGFDPQAASEKERRRVVAYLQRKGFTLSAILKQLKTQVWESD